MVVGALLPGGDEAGPAGRGQVDAGGDDVDLDIWEFPKIRGPYFGVLIIRILVFRVQY